jgi:hypothetical protein
MPAVSFSWECVRDFAFEAVLPVLLDSFLIKEAKGRTDSDLQLLPWNACASIASLNRSTAPLRRRLTVGVAELTRGCE